MTTEPRNADEPVTMADFAREGGTDEKKEQQKPEPRVLRVSFRDGSVEELRLDSEMLIGADHGTLHVFRYVGLRSTRKLTIAYPLDVVKSWQIIRPGEQPVSIRHPDPSVRRIVKFSGLAGEVPVGTIVEWMGDEVPCGWREVEK